MAQLGATFYPDGRIFTVAVIGDECDLNVHAQIGCVLVPLPIDTVFALYDPHQFRKACIPHVSKIDSKLASTVQAACDAIDLAAAEKMQQQAVAIASSLDAWNALPPAVQAALIAADAVAVPLP